MSEKFENALKDNRQAIVDGMRHENKVARGSTLANLIKYKPDDKAFVKEAEALLSDTEMFTWDTPICWLAAVYLDVVGARPYSGNNKDVLALIEAAGAA